MMEKPTTWMTKPYLTMDLLDALDYLDMIRKGVKRDLWESFTDSGEIHNDSTFWVSFKEGFYGKNKFGEDLYEHIKLFKFMFQIESKDGILTQVSW